jgi:DNA-binding HxlR family transcriptional regulator
MLVDEFMPVYDVSDAVATVVAADLATTWAALMDVDLIDVGRKRPLVAVLGALRIDALDSRKTMRFSRLREQVGGVSQKMLTKTLRQLERDGLVGRRVHAEVPPRVDYRLTPLGVTLGESVCGLWTWVEANLHDVERARRTYDAGAVRTRAAQRR